MYTEQTSPSSVINLSKTYGKITRHRMQGRAISTALLQVVERLEKYPDRRLRFASLWNSNASNELSRYLINNAR